MLYLVVWTIATSCWNHTIVILCLIFCSFIAEYVCSIVQYGSDSTVNILAVFLKDLSLITPNVDAIHQMVTSP
jgi:hypothetical protein